MTTAQQTTSKIEWIACQESPVYFAHEHVQIYDALEKTWIPFRLWKAQARTLKTIQQNRLVIILKARQLGVTWLALVFALWLMLFQPAATVLLFSRRDDEAIELLKRLSGIYARLPRYLQAESVVTESKHEMELSNGSRAMAFPTTGGDSYTATLVIADEFDLVQNQSDMLGSVQPTIDNGGRMILLSRPDKARPGTEFKNRYKGAMAGANDWTPVFLPWFVHPRRDLTWYEARKAEALTTTGSLDELHEQYPATEQEALQPSAASLIYPTFTMENVSPLAEYNPDWEVYWGCDDGYAYGKGPGDATYHPRVILLGQFDPTGALHIFAEYVKCLVPTYNGTIDEIIGSQDGQQTGWGYALPEVAEVDSSASMFRSALSLRGITNIGATHDVAEGIKNVRRYIVDQNGVRMLFIHPRCEHTIREMFGYKYDSASSQSKSGESKPLKIDDHCPDALRYLLWLRRVV